MGSPKKVPQKATGEKLKPVVTTIRIDRGIWELLRAEAALKRMTITECLEDLIARSLA